MVPKTFPKIIIQIWNLTSRNKKQNLNLLFEKYKYSIRKYYISNICIQEILKKHQFTYILIHNLTKNKK